MTEQKSKPKISPAHEKILQDKYAHIRAAVRFKQSDDWRWMEGMLTFAGKRVRDVDNVDADAIPNLFDPATVGCIYSLIREIRKAYVYVEKVGNYYVAHEVYDASRMKHSYEVTTEVEALLTVFEEGAF